MALAISIRSPNNWVISLTYGVSPQPAQAPEYSNNGCSNCEPLTVSALTMVRSRSGMLEEEVVVLPLALRGGPAWAPC